jgi:hypothetical protein
VSVRVLWVQDLEGTAEQLNFAALWKSVSQSALQASDTTDYPAFASDGDILIHVRDLGQYQYSAGTPDIVDGDLIIEPSTGPGYFKRISDAGDMAPIYVAQDIQETLPSVLVALDFSSISANSEATLTATIPGARPGDFVQVQPPDGLEDGLIVRKAWISAKNTASVRLRNLTGSGIDPTAGNYRFFVTSPNRMPTLSKRAIELFEALLNGDFDGTSLETALSDDLTAAHFWLLVSSRWRMQTLLDDSVARDAIENSAIADAILTAVDGAGY